MEFFALGFGKSYDLEKLKKLSESVNAPN